MKRVALITGHYFDSKRRAGFHQLAEAYHRAGWEVLFFTGALSWLSWLRRDYRFDYPVRREAHKMLPVRERLLSYVWFTPWHPANLRIPALNRLAYERFSRYGELPLGPAEAWLRSADLVLFESTPALLLFERIKGLAPQARFVYRVSDDLRLLKNHKAVLDAEDRFAPRFDLVSCPSSFIYNRFKHLPRAGLHYHGLAKEAFDRDCPSPYDGKFERNLVFVGNARFDRNLVDSASRMFPRWGFHTIGPVATPRRANVIDYGELPFEQTIPFIKHADVGLQTIEYAPGAESFTDSLKVIQYTYCRLPVVAPDFLANGRMNVICYRPGDPDSIRSALQTAEQFDRTAISASGIRSWDELALNLAGQ